MTSHLYVGNLCRTTSESTLRAAFEQDGRSVKTICIVTNSKKRPRGFAFVEMESEDQATAAIDTLDGTDLDGRPIKVGEGHPRPEFNLRPEPPRFSSGGGPRRRY